VVVGSKFAQNGSEKVRSKWLREKPYNGGRPCPKLDHLNQVKSLFLMRGGKKCGYITVDVEA